MCARGRSEEFFAADPTLAKQNLIFVLTRMQIEMYEYPRWCASQVYDIGQRKQCCLEKLAHAWACGQPGLRCARCSLAARSYHVISSKKDTTQPTLVRRTLALLS